MALGMRHEPDLGLEVMQAALHSGLGGCEVAVFKAKYQHTRSCLGARPLTELLHRSSSGRQCNPGCRVDRCNESDSVSFDYILTTY